MRKSGLLWLLLITLVTACGTPAAEPTPELDQTASLSIPEQIDNPAPEPAASPTAVASPTPAPPAATVTTEGCYDRGYAGRMRDRRYEDGWIYLLVEPPDDPDDAARAVAETLCQFGGSYTPSGHITVQKVNYTTKQLDTWYDQIRNDVWQVPGIWSSGIRLKENAVGFSVQTPLGKSRILDIAIALGVPEDALDIEVARQTGLNDPPANPSYAGIDLSVNFPERIEAGMPVEFEVVVINTSTENQTISYNSAHPVDIAVLDQEETEIWRKLTGALVQPGGSTAITPGESTSFFVEWHGLSHDELVPEPGNYWVRAFMNVRIERSGTGDASGDLATTPQPLQLIRAGQ